MERGGGECLGIDSSFGSELEGVSGGKATE